MKLAREDLLPVVLFVFVGVAAPLGKVHGKAVGAAGSDEPRAGLVEEVMRRGCLLCANVFRRSLYSAIGILAGMSAWIHHV